MTVVKRGSLRKCGVLKWGFVGLKADSGDLNTITYKGYKSCVLLWAGAYVSQALRQNG